MSFLISVMDPYEETNRDIFIRLETPLRNVSPHKSYKERGLQFCNLSVKTVTNFLTDRLTSSFPEHKTAL
jgi:hypothetical protein